MASFMSFFDYVALLAYFVVIVAFGLWVTV